MRKVKYFEWKQTEITGQQTKVEVGEAFFHEFGVYHDEYETGAGNYTTAVIELPDGTIKSIYVELIQFIEPYGRMKL